MRERVFHFCKKSETLSHTNKKREAEVEVEVVGVERESSPTATFYLLFFRLASKFIMALSSSLAPPPPCGATQRSPHSNTKHRFVPRQFARRPRTCAAAAAPRRGASSSSNDAPSTAAAASASFADFPATCPWPRPPTYSEQPAVEVQATRSMKNRVLLMMAKVRERRRENESRKKSKPKKVEP